MKMRMSKAAIVTSITVKIRRVVRDCLTNELPLLKMSNSYEEYARRMMAWKR